MSHIYSHEVNVGHQSDGGLQSGKSHGETKGTHNSVRQSPGSFQHHQASAVADGLDGAHHLKSHKKSKYSGQKGRQHKRHKKEQADKTAASPCTSPLKPVLFALFDVYMGHRCALERRLLAVNQEQRRADELPIVLLHYLPSKIYTYVECDRYRVAQEQRQLAVLQRERHPLEEAAFRRFVAFEQGDNDVIRKVAERMIRDEAQADLEYRSKLAIIQATLEDKHRCKKVSRFTEVVEQQDAKTKSIACQPFYAGVLAYAPTTIKGITINALLDGGSMVCLMTEAVRVHLGLSIRTDGKHSITGAGGSKDPLLGICENVPVTVAGIKTLVHFFITPKSSKDIFLGQNFLRQVQAKLEFKKDGSVILGLEDENGEATIEVTPKDDGSFKVSPETSDQQN
ncbi:hypothetical protein P7C70_g6990, partial [Phenoliferia sp. Uapishka_3]